MTDLEIFDMEQGSDEWFKVRLGVVTASRFKEVLAKGEGKMRAKYMRQLASERVRNMPAETFSNSAMERGKEFEAEARDLYTRETGNEVRLIGFMKRGMIGASADGLIGEKGLAEIKTRQPDLQVDLLISDRVPPEHKAQLQGNLWVSGREWIDFISYCPNLPIFIKRVERDEIFIAELKREIPKFEKEVSEMTQTIMDKF